MSAVLHLGRFRSSPATRTTTPPSTTATGILLSVATLNVVGLVMVLSSGSVASLRKNGSAWDFLVRQGRWTVLGTVALGVGWYVGPALLRRVRALLIAGTMLLLCAVLVPGIGTAKDGGRRWIDLGPLNLQPAELAKIALAVWVADLLARRARHVADPRMIFIPIAVVAVPILCLVVLEPDMGTAACIMLVVVGQIIASGVPAKHLAKAAGVVAVAGGALALAAPYRRRRILSFTDPLGSSQAGGYQVAQSLIGIGSGGPGGVGLGQSRAKWGFLPNAHTDFIFAIISEESGLAGALFVMGLFVVLAFFGVRAARRATDRYARLLAIGITTWLVGQAVLNVATVIGLLPVTGVPLPFVSYGGSALMVSMAGAGILAGIAAAGDRARAEAADAPRGPGPRTKAATPSSVADPDRPTRPTRPTRRDAAARRGAPSISGGFADHRSEPNSA